MIIVSGRWLSQGTFLICFQKHDLWPNLHSVEIQSDGEMLIRTLRTILLQIFCKIISYFKVIVKSILDPDDNFPRDYFPAVRTIELCLEGGVADPPQGWHDEEHEVGVRVRLPQ